MASRRSFGAVRKLPSGYFQASIPNPIERGARLNAPQTFTSRRDADTWISRQKVLLSEGRWQSESEKSLQNQSFLEFGLQHLKVQTSKRGGLLRESTRESQQGLLGRHLRSFHDCPIDEISKQQVDEWYAELVMTGKRTTAARAYSLLSAIMWRAVQLGIRQSNPCQIEGARTASSERRVEVPTDHQLESIITELPQKWVLQTYFLARTALRFGEMAALQVKDLLWDEGEIAGVRVNKAASCLRGGVRIDKPKSRMSRREVPIARDVSAALATHVVGLQPDDLLFPAQGGGVQRVDTFSKIFARAVKSANLSGEGISLHCLRHYGGTKFGETGASLAEIKSFLGDSSTKAAERYLHGSASGRGLIQKVTGLGTHLLTQNAEGEQKSNSSSLSG